MIIIVIEFVKNWFTDYIIFIQYNILAKIEYQLNEQKPYMLGLIEF